MSILNENAFQQYDWPDDALSCLNKYRSVLFEKIFIRSLIYESCSRLAFRPRYHIFKKEPLSCSSIGIWKPIDRSQRKGFSLYKKPESDPKPTAPMCLWGESNSGPETAERVKGPSVLRLRYYLQNQYIKAFSTCQESNTKPYITP